MSRWISGIIWKYSIYIMCGCLFTGLSTLKAQSSKETIAIIARLKTMLPDSVRTRLLLQLAEYYINTEWNYSNKKKVDSALPYLKEAKLLSEKSGYQNYLHRSLSGLGAYYFRCDNVPVAFSFYREAIAFAQKINKPDIEARTWFDFGYRIPWIPAYYDSISSHLLKALELSIKLKDSILKARCMVVIADIHVSQGKLDLAEKEYFDLYLFGKAFHYVKGPLAIYRLSQLHSKKGNYNNALKYGIEAIKYCESIPDSLNLHLYLSNVASIYTNLEQPAKSLEYYKQAMDFVNYKLNESIWKNNTQYQLLRPTLLNMIALDKKKQALAYLKEFQRKFPPRTDFSRIFLSSSTGDCCKSMGDLASAASHYTMAAKLALRTRQIDEIKEQYFLLAGLYVNMANYAMAQNSIDSIVKYTGDTYDAPRLSGIHLLRFKIDSAKGNYLSAIKEYQRSRALSDSIFSAKKTRQIGELTIQYETAKAEQEITHLQNKANLQEAKYLKADFLKKIILAGLIFVSIVLGLAVIAYRAKQKANRRLKWKQEQINQTNASLQKLVQEKEWLIKEIHHRVKNNLHTISSLLDSQTSYVKNDQEKNVIRDSRHRIQAMSLLHQKLYLTKDIQAVDIAFYIQELVAYLKESFKTDERIRFELDVEPVILDVSPAVSLALILNEVITNALKYAFPDNRPGIISVTLRGQSTNFYRLSITDNGIGLPVGFDIQRNSTLGLTLIQGLVKDIDGIFSICSSAGTRISIDFPKSGNDPDQNLLS